MKNWQSVAAVLLAMSALPGVATAQGQGKGKAPTSSTSSAKSGTSVGDTVRTALPASEPVFASRDITVIQTWFRTNTSNLPPGLAKRETLPPGLQKQLIRKGTLPPGLQAKIQPLPVVLERQLPAIPTGCPT